MPDREKYTKLGLPWWLASILAVFTIAEVIRKFGDTITPIWRYLLATFIIVVILLFTVMWRFYKYKTLIEKDLNGLMKKYETGELNREALIDQSKELKKNISKYKKIIEDFKIRWYLFGQILYGTTLSRKDLKFTHIKEEYDRISEYVNKMED